MHGALTELSTKESWPRVCYETLIEQLTMNKYIDRPRNPLLQRANQSQPRESPATSRSLSRDLSVCLCRGKTGLISWRVPRPAMEARYFKGCGALSWDGSSAAQHSSARLGSARLNFVMNEKTRIALMATLSESSASQSWETISNFSLRNTHLPTGRTEIPPWFDGRLLDKAGVD